jgi:hypothetical protein
LLQLQTIRLHKPRDNKGLGKSAFASSIIQDLENPAAENPEAGKEHDEPSIVDLPRKILSLIIPLLNLNSM